MLAIIFLLVVFHVATSQAEFTAQKSPLSQNARFDNINRNERLGGIKLLFDGFANTASDIFRYYVANPYKNFRHQPAYPEASIRYQRLTYIYPKDSKSKRAQVVVTAPTCPVANDPKPCGGDQCTKDLDCNSVNQGGLCNFNSTTPHGLVGTCVCANGWVIRIALIAE